MTRRAQPEAQLQRSVVAHLRWRAVPNVWWAHIPNGGWRSPVEAAILKSMGVVAGTPDLAIIYAGRSYFLELKATRGRLSPAQIETHDRLRLAGAEVATVHDIDQALQQLGAWGLLRGGAR